jgi:hypothetical protein
MDDMLPITQPNPQKIQNRNQQHIPIPFISNQRWTNREPLAPISTTQAHAAQTNFSAFALPTTKVLSSLLFSSHISISFISVLRSSIIITISHLLETNLNAYLNLGQNQGLASSFPLSI